MTFHYDDPTHTYTLDGYKIPSVSALLDMLFPKDFKGPALVQGMSKGKYIHKCCNMDYHKLLNMRKLEPEIKPYIKHFRDFKKKHLDPINCIWEKPTYNKIYKYGCTPDIVDETNKIIYDIKTGKKPGTKLQERYKMQLWAYMEAVASQIKFNQKYSMCIIYLDGNGEAKPVPVTHDRYGKNWNMFRQALSIYNFSRR